MRIHAIVSLPASRSRLCETILRARGLRPVLVRTKSQMRRELIAASATTCTVIIAGGDGTFNVALSQYLTLSLSQKKNLSFVILPGGTANDLARSLGATGNLHRSLDALLAGERVQRDIITANGAPFITGGGVGLPDRVVRSVQKLRAIPVIGILGTHPLIYSVLALVHALFTSVATGQGDALGVLIQNQDRIGAHFIVAPGARPNDGRFDIVFYPTGSLVWRLGIVLRTQAGTHTRDVSIKRDSKAVLKISPTETFAADGEIIARGPWIRLRTLHNAITLVRSR